MTVRLLAPADPVRRGRLVTVNASVRADPPREGTASWEWDDGERDEAALPPVTAQRTSRTHRYAKAGVYRVIVRVGPLIDEAIVRYVSVARPDQAAGSGWVSDRALRRPVPFGFLLTPGGEGAADALVLRCAMPAGELRSTDLTWLLVSGDGSLHFGGNADVVGRDGIHPFRVDAHGPLGRGRSRQQLAISMYAPRDVPGRDSPIERVAGAIRPGRVELGPLTSRVRVERA